MECGEEVFTRGRRKCGGSDVTSKAAAARFRKVGSENRSDGTDSFQGREKSTKKEED